MPEQQRVNAENPNQGNLFKIKALGNHLGAEQNVIVMPGKLGQHCLMGVLT